MNHPVLSQFSRRAMATEFVIMLPGVVDQTADGAFKALAELESIENRLSIYRSESDVSRLNHNAGIGPVKVSADTIEVLRRAIELSQLSGGAFDVTAGPLVEAWGFTKRSGHRPTNAQIATARQCVGFDKLLVDSNAGTAMLSAPGMSVNLGAIGKGFALDRIAAILVAGGMTDFLVHGGRSSVLASGDDVPDSGDGWKVAIEHPLLQGVRLGGLRLKNQSLGTSGSGKQFFHHQGQRLGHVIDPRTGWPAGDMLSLTVVAKTAMDADALATGLFVKGWQEAATVAIDDMIGMVAVLPTKQHAGVAIHHVGLSDDSWLVESDVESDVGRD